ncbi:MAG: nicotinic acid mononucleotide adenylyltransferase [Rhodobacterales bacterium]|nr:nicotinic acid mononucleotide adenylyltransferase [Rhodobacterales bacterium]
MSSPSATNGSVLKTSPPRIRTVDASSWVGTPKLFVESAFVEPKIENELNTVYTSQTLKLIQIRCPNVRFVWLMGADNMIQFDKWMNWKEIVYRVPIGILARPDHTLAPLKSKLAKAFSSYRLRANQSRDLGNLKAPSWCYKNLPLLNVSSSQIRAS